MPVHDPPGLKFEHARSNEMVEPRPLRNLVNLFTLSYWAICDPIRRPAHRLTPVVVRFTKPMSPLVTPRARQAAALRAPIKNIADQRKMAT